MISLDHGVLTCYFHRMSPKNVVLKIIAWSDLNSPKYKDFHFNFLLLSPSLFHCTPILSSLIGLLHTSGKPDIKEIYAFKMNTNACRSNYPFICAISKDPRSFRLRVNGTTHHRVDSYFLHLTTHTSNLTFCMYSSFPFSPNNLSSDEHLIIQSLTWFKLQDKELHGIAFIDSNIYIHQIHALKNFLLVGDVYQSINVLQYQQDYRWGVLDG